VAAGADPRHLVTAATGRRDAGDHWIVVGHVHSILMSPLDDPLVFFAGTIGGLE
jgi:flavin reductase (DIM6/NTAB) family NADH-FMN oxidoreductase RutF